MKRYSIGIALFLAVSTAAYPQSYDSQKSLDDEIKSTAESLSFLEFDSESSMGETSRCQLQYRTVLKENLYKTGEPQIVQGSVTTDYYQNKPINFILNVQPLRLDVNMASREAKSESMSVNRATLIINGFNLEKYQLQPIDCENGQCIAYAPKTGDEIVLFMKAAQAKPIFDAEIAFSSSKSPNQQVLRLSNVPTHGMTNSEVRKQFTSCLNELLKKEVNDISKVDR